MNEFCYKFNRKYFVDGLFDRLMTSFVNYKPKFEYKTITLEMENIF